MEYYNFLDIIIIARMGAGVIMLLLGFFALYKNPYSQLNKYFGAFAFISSLWAFGLSFQGAALTPELAIIWGKIANMGSSLMTPPFLIFILVFTKKYKLLNNFFTYFISFGVGVSLFVWGNIVSSIKAEDVYRTLAGWKIPLTLPTVLSYIWIPSVMLVAIFFCWDFYRKTKDNVEKKQALFIIIAGITPLVSIVFSQIIFPLTTKSVAILNISSLFSSLSTLVIATSFLYATLRYRLFAILTPAATADIVIETMNDGLIVSDKDLKVEFVNNAVVKISGLEKEKIIGRHVKEAFFRDEKVWNELYEKIILRSKEGKTVEEIEGTLTNSRGDIISVSFFGSGIRNEGEKLIGYVITIQDTRRNKRLIAKLEENSLELAEKIKALETYAQETEKTRLATLNILEDVEDARVSLEVEKKRIEDIILSLTDGLLVLQNNKILLLNPAAEEILRTKKGDVLLKSLSALKTNINISTLNQFKEKNSKKNIFREEIILPEPERTFQISIIPIGVAGELMILHDINREKLIERMKTEFVSLAAHQLRTPLSAIKWTLRMILDGDLGKISKEQRDFLEKTYQSNERMISLINDLLNVTRIEEGRYLSKLTPIKIIDIVQPIVKTYKDEMKKKKIKFDFIVPKEKSPEIEADSEKIGLAVENLIDNALRYTTTGGRVTIMLKYGKKEVEILVQDSGVGIPKDQQERIFSKFFRASNVVRMETEGSGLGLFIMKNIIEAHAGKVWFETEEGKGSTFHIIFPIKEGATKKKI